MILGYLGFLIKINERNEDGGCLHGVQRLGEFAFQAIGMKFSVTVEMLGSISDEKVHHPETQYYKKFLMAFHIPGSPKDRLLFRLFK